MISFYGAQGYRPKGRRLAKQSPPPRDPNSGAEPGPISAKDRHYETATKVSLGWRAPMRVDISLVPPRCTKHRSRSATSCTSFRKSRRGFLSVEVPNLVPMERPLFKSVLHVSMYPSWIMLNPGTLFWNSPEIYIPWRTGTDKGDPHSR